MNNSIVTGAGLNSFRKVFPGSAVYALAEIIDNSIQWKRKDISLEIEIVLVEHKFQSKFRLSEIVIIDNGVGMDYETISNCLVFGGGQNHGTIKDDDLGKFGLGLPYSSCSVSPNYHVYSWQNKKEIFHTFRNHRSFSGNQEVFKEKVNKYDAIPQKLKLLKPSISKSKSGTVVQWQDCDNLNVSQAATFINHINLNLGRIYRHLLGEDVKINISVFRTDDDKEFIKQNELTSSIKIFDPLFLLPNTIAGTDPTSDLHKEKDITFIEKKIDGSEISHVIKIVASIAKEEIQSPNGGDGGKTDEGKLYKKATGISLVRSRRELKLGKFGFDFPNSNGPTNRWWGLEVHFQPISDEIMNVSANKLDAKAFRYIDSDSFLENSKEGLTNERERLRYELSKEVDKLIKDMHKKLKERKKGTRKNKKCPNCEERKFVKGYCNACGYESDVCEIHSVKRIDGHCPVCKNLVDPYNVCLIHGIQKKNDICPECGERKIELSENDKKKLSQLISIDYPELKGKPEEINRVIDYFCKSNQNLFIVFADAYNKFTFIQHDEFPKSPDSNSDSFTIIEVNTSHPFFEKFMQPVLNTDDEDKIIPLLLFISSWVVSETKDYSNSEILESFRGKFGYNLNEVMEQWETN